MDSVFKTKLTLRIDWSELDLFGHVNNVMFFKYIQAARVNYCEKIGLTSLSDATKSSFMVASSQCQFKKPLLYPGDITVYTKVDWIKNTSLQLSYSLVNSQNEKVAEASDVLVIYDHFKKTKIPVSLQLRSVIRALEGIEF